MTHPRNYIPMNQQRHHNPRKLAPIKLNDSTVKDFFSAIDESIFDL